MNTLQDRIRGSLIGGAIGDALGYPVEFIYSFEGIQARYGERGITRLDTKQFWLDDEEQSGKAWPCLPTAKMLTLGIVQTSLALHSLNRIISFT